MEIVRKIKKAAAPVVKVREAKTAKAVADKTHKRAVKEAKETKVAAPAKEKAVKAPKAAKEHASGRGFRGMTGATSGLGIIQFQNELMRKNFRAKLDDETLAKAMRDEFPSAIAYTAKHVVGIRSGWNKGLRGNDAPEVLLSRFDGDGNAVGRNAPKREKAAAAPKKAKSKVAKS